MKKRVISILVMSVAIICLAGCGKERDSRHSSTLECSHETIKKDRRDHDNADRHGKHIERDEEVGIAMTKVDTNNEYSGIYTTYEENNKMPEILPIKEDDFWKFFDMVDTGLHVEISPGEHYRGCRFSNCQILIQGYLGTEFMDLGYADINERGFGRAEWYGLSDEEQKEIQIEKLLVISKTGNADMAPQVDLADTVSDIEAWMPKTEKIEVGKYDFDKYFNLTQAMESDPDNGYYLFVITPKEEYKYCEFNHVEVTMGYITDDGLVQQTHEVGPLELKMDGTEYIELRVNYLTEFTGIEMGRFGEIVLK